MPVCKRCGRQAATIEMRSAKNRERWYCKDKSLCMRRKVDK